VLVPVDFRASDDLVRRIAGIVKAKAVLLGAEVRAAGALGGPVFGLGDVIDVQKTTGAPAPTPPVAGVTGATLAEIIFTSGATADPKGVTITHRNVLANIIPIEREVRKYRRYERPFHPIRFLNLLPMSHMFGQSMATFVPPMLGGTVVFSHGYSPAEIVRQIRSRRVSVLVCVPKVLDMLRTYIEHAVPEAAAPDALAGRHWLRRWWHYRDVHRLFGWKFWCIVCGAAPLPPDLEAFYRKVGLLVVQGYGLTETAPVVTLNHPLRASRGTVGKPIAGVEVRIAADGEILVRGDNVTRGYFTGAPAPDAPGSAAAREQTTTLDEGGWFHTGDVGELDDKGQLVIKGRKKEMIATSQGLKVFPEDVERALLAQPGVVDAAVVGRTVDGEERVHAVVILGAGGAVEPIVAAANRTLEDHQRVWSASAWPGPALPRTEGTHKLRRKEIQRWVAGEAPGAARETSPSATVAGVVSRFAGGRTVTADTTLEALGLSSLDRVEMVMAIEQEFHASIDEAALAAIRTVGDLDRLVTSGHVPASGAAPSGASTSAPRPDAADLSPVLADHRKELVRFPRWNRSRLSWWLRRVSLPTWILPLARPFVRLEVAGREHLDRITDPVIFAANHQSHMDGPVILLALPPRLRYAVAPAMAKEFFKAHFFPQEFPRWTSLRISMWYYLACQFFNAFPLPQREVGTRDTLRYIGEITADGYHLLIFPEGKRHPGGAIGTFRAGVGMIASRLGLPVVPVRIDGLDRVLGVGMTWPARGAVRVAFGPPLALSGDDYAALARRIEEAVEQLGTGA
jgi:long-chain acyl-CoA synthetase